MNARGEDLNFSLFHLVNIKVVVYVFFYNQPIEWHILLFSEDGRFKFFICLVDTIVTARLEVLSERLIMSNLSTYRDWDVIGRKI